MSTDFVDLDANVITLTFTHLCFGDLLSQSSMYLCYLYDLILFPVVIYSLNLNK